MTIFASYTINNTAVTYIVKLDYFSFYTKLSVVDRDRVEVATREIFWVAAESGRDPNLFFGSRPSWVATLGRDRVDPKKTFFRKSSFSYKINFYN